MSALLPNTAEGKVIKNQLTKAGTSIGANYEEANRSRSKADFLNKIKISESEASETIYWMKIITEMSWVELKKTESISQEVTEILVIFASISKTIKST